MHGPMPADHIRAVRDRLAARAPDGDPASSALGVVRGLTGRPRIYPRCRCNAWSPDGRRKPGTQGLAREPPADWQDVRMTTAV